MHCTYHNETSVIRMSGSESCFNMFMNRGSNYIHGRLPKTDLFKIYRAEHCDNTEGVWGNLSL